MARRAALGGAVVPPGECDNLTALANLNEDTLLKELEIRYNKDVIYTYVGEILVAVNPYFTIPGLYDQAQKNIYRGGVDRDAQKPHIFATADAAVSALKGTGKNQVCVISGESGAGKTESAKLFLQHIIDLSSPTEDTQGLATKIIKVNPLLEAFGNAATLMNDNSSRFGKYLDLQFNESFGVRGAFITEYLLEKSRVVSQADGEQNFHIFYYLFAGLDATLQAQYELGNAEDHAYVNSNDSALAYIKTADCKAMWQEVFECFDLVGFTAKEKDELFAVLSGILWLGDVEFAGDDKAGIVSPASVLDTACRQLGLSSDAMEGALVEQMLITGGETTTKALQCHQAEDVRDATAKALYGRAFTWIIKRVNTLTGPKGGAGSNNKISFLDIFGFEHFEENSFEQLCINLANEQLQSFFNSHIFQMELDEYAKEGIDGSKVTFKNNQSTLDMILQRRPPGLLAIMDEQAIMPRATDASMAEKFHATFGSHEAYIKPRSNDPLFSIVHYAGQVEYQAEGFLEKNRDTLALDVLAALRLSENTLVRELFEGDAEDAKAAKGARGKRAGRGASRNNMRMSMRKARQAEAKKQRKSVGTTFKESLEKLMVNLNAASPHFIRCIKPNASKAKHVYEGELVKNQLRYTGMLETTRIRKEGYAVRPTFGDFLHRYQSLTYAWNIGQAANAAACRMLLEKAQLKDWQIGKSKVFLRYYHPDELNELAKPIAGAVTNLQKCCRGFIARRRHAKLVAEAAAYAKQVEALLSAAERNGATARDAMSFLGEQDAKRDWSAGPDSYEMHTPRGGSKTGKGKGKGGGMKRMASVRWFKEVEKAKGMGMQDEKNEGGVGGFAQWFHGVISRVESETLLNPLQVGTFLIRVSESRFGYSLSTKTPNRIKHFMIDQSPDGQYMVVGNDRLFPSLNELVAHHRNSPLTEEGDKLLIPCPQKESNLRELMD
eukprot:TRINITY_DN11819_c4_g2_i6.p1 TRINITY_DN11819_c4_g2~~TRINITY_DN11819_c4_g2_i6.p1  ORF type:complete len:949 (+),score=327.87 TRINITY_DN11819_c4_g2_i6:88-2934(+)